MLGRQSQFRTSRFFLAPPRLAFARLAARPFAAIALRCSALRIANPLGTLASPPFFPMEARYSLTGDLFLVAIL